MESWLQKRWQAIKQALAKAGEYLSEHKYTAIFITGVVVLALICWAGYLHLFQGMTWVPGTGFSQYVDADGKLQRGKTLWDWLELLIIPFVLALGAWWLQRSERDSDRKLAEERRKDDQQRAKDQQQETALQDYIDKMTELLLDEKHPLRDSKPEDEVRVVARTRTLATLRGLDAVRKGLLLKFLYEAELITPRESKNDGDNVKGNEVVELSVINLCGADLRGADLHETDLRGADLNETDLREADLREADLREADLSGADLSRAHLIRTRLVEANLIHATLRGADLSRANLSKADLIGASLVGAGLRHAHLRGADLRQTFLRRADLSRADLTVADLRGAHLRESNLSEADLSGADLRGTRLGDTNLLKAFLYYTTMPDGKKYDPAMHIIDEDGRYMSNSTEEK